MASTSGLRKVFIAMLPDPHVQAAVGEHQARWFWPPDTHLTSSPRLHLTLYPPQMVDDLAIEQMHETLARLPIPVMELVLRTPVVFRGGTAVLLPEASPPLQAWHAHMDQALHAQGWPADRHWIPHVTLAHRVPRAAPPEASPPIRWCVRGFAMIWSQLAPEFRAARYEVLHTYGKVQRQSWGVAHFL